MLFRAGGNWLVTDMRRGESMFELDLNAQEIVERGIESEGSNLSGVSARCSWVEKDFSETGCNEEGGILREGPRTRPEPLLDPRISEQETQQIKNELKKGLLNYKAPNDPIIKSEDFNKLDV